MECLTCKVELIRAGNWAYCPQCNQSYSSADLEMMLHEEAERQREELKGFVEAF